MFGPYSKNKALCGCGALTDLDSEVIRLKKNLGKRVECITCRNHRIAEEHQLLEMHYLDLEEENTGRP